MYAKIRDTKDKAGILKQLIDIKNEIRKREEESVIQRQLFDESKGRFFEPIVEEQKKLEKNIQDVSKSVILKPEFPQALTDNEKLFIQINRDVLLDVTTSKNLDIAPLREIERRVEAIRDSIDNARNDVKTRKISDRRRIQHNGNISKAELYLEYLEQYIYWRKSYRKIDESESSEGSGMRRVKGHCVTLLGTPEQILDDLHLKIASMRAGNTSIQLKNEVVNILDYLHKHRHISSKTYKDFQRILSNVK